MSESDDWTKERAARAYLIKRTWDENSDRALKAIAKHGSAKLYPPLSPLEISDTPEPLPSVIELPEPFLYRAKPRGSEIAIICEGILLVQAPRQHLFPA